MLSPNPSVVALVLNYNGREVLLEALASLSRLDYEPCDLVVIDNGSNDGSVAAVEQRFPAVRVLSTPQNLGPAGGCNLGLHFALEKDYDYALVLNNDIEVEPGMLRELVEVAGSQPLAGCVGPKEYYYWDRQRIWSAGGVLRFREAITRERGMGHLDHGQFDQIEEVDYINGCAMLIQSDALRRTGPWDPIYSLGVEDADFCTRLKKLGYRCYYAPRARLWHMVSHNTGVYSPGKTFHTGRSTAIYLRRYAGLLGWMTSVTAFVLSLPIAFCREALRGNSAAVAAKAKGFLAGLRAPMSEPPSFDLSSRRAVSRSAPRHLGEHGA